MRSGWRVLDTSAVVCVYACLRVYVCVCVCVCAFMRVCSVCVLECLRAHVQVIFVSCSSTVSVSSNYYYTL